MILDKTRIAVRERSFVEILDLALLVFRTFATRLLPILSAGAIPMIVLNQWLLSGYSETGLDDQISIGHAILLLLLVFFEAPFATAPATLYLGQAMFRERPDTRRAFTDYLHCLPQLLLYQGLLRVFFLRWLYLNEVILLERNPIRPKKGNPSTTYSRGRRLHRGEGVDVLGRWFANMLMGGMLFLSTWGSILLLCWFFLSAPEWDAKMQMLCVQMALWIVIGYFTVARLLCYLDLRIRREGWEVELAMRAEATRLTKAWS